MLAYNHTINFASTYPEHFLQNTLYFVQSMQENINKFPIKIEFNNNQEREITLYSDQELSNSIENKKWVFVVTNVLHFYWKDSTPVIHYTLLTYGTQELLEYWMLHTLLPIYFSLQNKYYFFHAGAINVNNSAIALLAESYGGKSTLTDYFLNKKANLELYCFINFS